MDKTNRMKKGQQMEQKVAWIWAQHGPNRVEKDKPDGEMRL